MLDRMYPLCLIFGVTAALSHLLYSYTPVYYLLAWLLKPACYYTALLFVSWQLALQLHRLQPYAKKVNSKGKSVLVTGKFSFHFLFEVQD